MTAGSFLSDLADGRVVFEGDLSTDGLIEATAEAIEEAYAEVLAMTDGTRRRFACVQLVKLIDRIMKRAPQFDLGDDGVRWMQDVMKLLGHYVFGIDPHYVPQVPEVTAEAITDLHLASLQVKERGVVLHGSSPEVVESTFYEAHAR